MTLEQLLADTKPALLEIQQRDLTDIRQAKDWQSKYRVLMQLGKKLPPVPEKLSLSQILAS